MVPLFEIRSDRNDKFYWSDILTDDWGDIKIPSSNHHIVSGAWGSAIFQNVKREEYDIWYNHYHCIQRRRLHLSSESSVIIFSFLIENNLFQSYSPYTHRLVKESQFNIFYLPFIEKNIVFESGERYTILEIHCTVPFLKKLEDYFPNVIYEFLSSIGKSKPVQIFPIHIFGTSSMVTITKQIIRELRSLNVNELILELNVKLLLSYAIACKNELLTNETTISTKQLSEINRISNVVLKNFFDPPIVTDLAKKAGMNETTFKRLFKMITQKPPYQYWSDHRMEAAFEKIVSTTDSITNIALDLGFSTVTNFSKAFKKYYKLSPSAYRK